jgi:hypothetical protein
VSDVTTVLRWALVAAAVILWIFAMRENTRLARTRRHGFRWHLVHPLKTLGAITEHSYNFFILGTLAVICATLAANI